MSHGRINEAELAKVQADLSGIYAAAGPARHANPILSGGRSLGRLSKAIYHRVVLVIASL